MTNDNGSSNPAAPTSEAAAQDEREQAYREATKPRPETSGVGEYCQPGDRREQRWIVMYDDADRSLSVFEDEQDARDCFANSEAMGWNCWLFSPTPRVRAASPAAPAQSAEPIYQVRLANGSWQDINERAYQYNIAHCPEDNRIVYTCPQPSPTAVVLTDDARDAARYRWIRNGHICMGRQTTLLMTEGALDAAIDAVLTAARPANGETE